MRHRVHSSTTGGESGGRGHNGGVWEWTSTEFDGYEGFVPLSLYPGFSADFFDTLHNVVVSGHPLIALFFFFPDMHSRSRFEGWRVLRDDTASSRTPHPAQLLPA
jgi:formylglycine-generating enzyme required for sulfatase activity